MKYVVTLLEAINDNKTDNGDSFYLDDNNNERGISGTMSTEYDPKKRIHMLLVNGMLHLVGYNHIDDGNYKEMVSMEEKALKELLVWLNNKNEKQKSFLGTA